MKSKWIMHRGRRIQYADYTGFGGNLEGLKAEVEAATEETLKEPPDSVLSLVDVSGTSGTPEIMDYLKAAAARTKPHVLKMAVVGVQGYKKILLRAVITFTGQAMQPCDSIEEAKQWLTS